jgi:hypothetical protein
MTSILRINANTMKKVNFLVIFQDKSKCDSNARTEIAAILRKAGQVISVKPTLPINSSM